LKVFFDECVPRPLMKLFPEYEIRTAQDMGWGRKKNGELLKLAETQFEIFVTTDTNLRYQQNLKERRIALLVLSPNNLHLLKSKYQEIAAAIASLQPSQYRELFLK
jgi:predicted nuclease of predicted toxin-antitoxin system